MRTLVIGGARSGKSRAAEAMLAGTAGVTYVATAYPADHDPEWTARVAAHRARRPATWSTVETLELTDLLVADGGPLLVDCLTLWLTDRLDRAGAWDQPPSGPWRDALGADVAGLLAALRGTQAQVVLVSNEVGQGVVPASASGRLFQDEQGRLNIQAAEVADRVVLVVAGHPLLVKGAW